MTRIGYLIPEFPGQTHAFFMRERAELQRRGVATALYSTRPPSSGAAQHAWADAARQETTWLTPLTLPRMLTAVWTLLTCGPAAWVRCLMVVLCLKDLSPKERIRTICLIPVAALLLNDARRIGWQHLHIHSCASAAYLGMFLNRLSGLTYSLTLHGPLHDYGPNQTLKWQYAGFVVVITQELLDSVHQQLPADRLPPLLLAPMGVDPEKFIRSQPYHSASRDTTVRLISCGRIHPCKGHDDLLRAVHLLRQQGIDAQVTICGATDGRRLDYLELLQSLIQELQLEGVAHLLGSVSEDRVRSELEQSHVFCLASHKEPLGVATMEAMAMEMPAIVTESPGVAEMICSGVNGILVPAFSPDAIASAVLELLDHPKHAQRLAAQARLTVKQRFHSGVSAQVIQNGLSLKSAQPSDRSAAIAGKSMAPEMTPAPTAGLPVALEGGVSNR